MENFKEYAHNVITIEQQAIEKLHDYIDENFALACQLMFTCQGRVIVLGVGKSGHIGNKIAATLASTGTPAFFVHAGEASHGDIGMITKQDVVLAISNSGETHELIAVIPVIKRIGAKLIAMTGNPNSNLAKFSDTLVNIQIEQEACPHGLAPTSSSTATLVMGDAMAVALLKARGFTASDFALSHPGGNLGKKLLLKLNDIMHTNERLPCISQTALIKDALLEISQKGLGMTAITNSCNKLVGIFTDGDLRRVLDENIDIYKDTINSVMVQKPIVAKPDMLAAEALNTMQTKKINGLIIVDNENQPIGAMNMHDLLTSGVV